MKNPSSITKHKSVLTTEVIEQLNLRPQGVYVDATFGSGGHSQAILEAQPDCRLFAIDWDKEAIDRFAPTMEERYGERFKILWGNFAAIEKILGKENIKSVDGILADFGTSQFQLMQKEGFSFHVDSPLDMRMSKAHQKITAAEIVNRFSQKALEHIFFELGEERHSKKIVLAIIEARGKRKIKTTKELASIVEMAVSRFSRDKNRKGRKIHPATRIFQALRIYINKEFENIDHFLPAALRLMKPTGRLVVISFHSLEDRRVKQFFNSHKKELKILTPKPLVPTTQEILENPSARSAKLRAGEKIQSL